LEFIGHEEALFWLIAVIQRTVNVCVELLLDEPGEQLGRVSLRMLEAQYDDFVFF